MADKIKDASVCHFKATRRTGVQNFAIRRYLSCLQGGKIKGSLPRQAKRARASRRCPKLCRTAKNPAPAAQIQLQIDRLPFQSRHRAGVQNSRRHISAPEWQKTSQGIYHSQLRQHCPAAQASQSLISRNISPVKRKKTHETKRSHPDCN